MATEIKIKVDRTQLDQLPTQIKKVDSSFQQLETKGKTAAARMSSAFSSFSRTLGAVGLAFGTSEIIRIFSNLVTETIAVGDAVAKLSQATGAGTEFLSGMAFAAQR